METTEERLTQIFLGAVRKDRISPRLEHWIGDLQEFTLADFGISSVEGQALQKKIEDAFGIEIPPEDAEKLASLQDLTRYIEARR
ncbi:MAG: phosphopantetheine-binding protein [Acidobacteria bacterium]|nr:phosphopantetheine-binding protein [Acidobacteriota bacterium]